MLRAVVVVTSLVLLSACAEPPSKEMHQAQGAIDAAKAAGAGQYAADELKGAVDALAQSDVAVTARDYRLALSYALDSRERAQNAAKVAVDARAKARGDAERVLAEATAIVEREKHHLARHGYPLPSDLKLGVMVEVPSLLFQIEEICGILGQSPEATRHSIFRAVAKIRRTLAPLVGVQP